jgi:hypothetical protein
MIFRMPFGSYMTLAKIADDPSLQRLYGRNKGMFELPRPRPRNELSPVIPADQSAGEVSASMA